MHQHWAKLGEGRSARRVVSAAIVGHLRGTRSNIDVTYRDLVAEPLAHLTLSEWSQLDRGGDVQQFLDADVVVIGVGFYNFSIASQLKAWLDRIAVRGRTFAYGEAGPIGFATGKRVIVALACGNVYGEGSPYAGFEHAQTLLRAIFTFIGSDVEFVIAEGLGRGEEARRAAINLALERGRRVSLQIAD